MRTSIYIINYALCGSVGMGINYSFNKSIGANKMINTKEFQKQVADVSMQIHHFLREKLKSIGVPEEVGVETHTFILASLTDSTLFGFKNHLLREATGKEKNETLLKQLETLDIARILLLTICEQITASLDPEEKTNA